MAKLLEDDYEQIHIELQDEKRQRINMRKELEEANSRVKRDLETKELELIQRNAELAEAKERQQELSDEIKQKKKELQQQKSRLDANEERFDQIKDKLDTEVKSEQKKL